MAPQIDDGLILEGFSWLRLISSKQARTNYRAWIPYFVGIFRYSLTRPGRAWREPGAVLTECLGVDPFISLIVLEKFPPQHSDGGMTIPGWRRLVCGFAVLFTFPDCSLFVRLPYSSDLVSNHSA